MTHRVAQKSMDGATEMQWEQNSDLTPYWSTTADYTYHNMLGQHISITHLAYPPSHFSSYNVEQ